MKNQFISLSRNMTLISAFVLTLGIAQFSFTNLAHAQFGGIGSVTVTTDTSGGVDATTTGNSGGIVGGDATTTGNSGGITGPDTNYPVTSTVPPVISGTPSNISTTTDSSEGAVVTFTIPSATDTIDGTVPVTCDPGSGSTFPVGTTVVTCTATDTLHNSASTTFDVIVATPAPVAPPVTPTTDNTGGGSSSSSSGGSFSSGGSSVVPLVLTSSTTPVVINSCPLLTSYLQFGKNNDSSEVTKLQAFLKESQGFNVNVNGIFDQLTQNAVKAFQAKYLSQIMGPWGVNQPSGYVYITTEKKINEIACNTTLTLTPAELAIIDAFKAQALNNQNNAGTPVAPAAANASTTPTVTASSTAPSTTTPIAPEVGQTGIGAAANTGAAANAPAATGFVNAIVNFFKHLF